MHKQYPEWYSLEIQRIHDKVVASPKKIFRDEILGPYLQTKVFVFMHMVDIIKTYFIVDCPTLISTVTAYAQWVSIPICNR